MTNIPSYSVADLIVISVVCIAVVGIAWIVIQKISNKYKDEVIADYRKAKNEEFERYKALNQRKFELYVMETGAEINEMKRRTDEMLKGIDICSKKIANDANDYVASVNSKEQKAKNTVRTYH